MKSAICLFTDSPRPSGMGEHMLALAAELRGRYSVSFVCPATLFGAPLLARARALSLEARPLEEGAGPEAYGRLSAWLRARRVEVFHEHAGLVWEGHGGVRAAREAGVPVVVRTEHLPDLTSAPWIVDAPWREVDYERQISAVDLIVCVSREARESFLRRNVPEHKVRFVRNGIRPRAAASGRASVREALGVVPGDRVVLTVGRLVERKGYRVLLEAVPAVAEREPEAHFLWVGEGPLEDDLRQRIRTLGLEGRVRLLGRREDVADLLSAADLFVLPSFAEGLPLAVLEAMAAGLPVVGTRVCGTSEAILDGVTGRLVGAGDAGALAAAILEPLGDTRLAAAWGAAGRSLVEREFGAGRMGRETAEIYEELLAEHASATTAGHAVARSGEAVTAW